MSSHIYYNSKLSETQNGFHKKTQITKNYSVFWISSEMFNI